MAHIILHLETQLCCQEQHKKEMSHVADLSQPSRYILLSLHILPYFFCLIKWWTDRINHKQKGSTFLNIFSMICFQFDLFDGRSIKKKNHHNSLTLSHLSIHFEWKSCVHGSRRSFSRLLYSPIHTTHFVFVSFAVVALKRNDGIWSISKRTNKRIIRKLSS